MRSPASAASFLLSVSVALTFINTPMLQQEQVCHDELQGPRFDLDQICWPGLG
jgi:hypothetical protein